MIELVNNLPPLRIDTPEWHPGRMKEEEEDKNIEV